MTRSPPEVGPAGTCTASFRSYQGHSSVELVIEPSLILELCNSISKLYLLLRLKSSVTNYSRRRVPSIQTITVVVMWYPRLGKHQTDAPTLIPAYRLFATVELIPIIALLRHPIPLHLLSEAFCAGLSPDMSSRFLTLKYREH